MDEFVAEKTSPKEDKGSLDGYSTTVCLGSTLRKTKGEAVGILSIMIIPGLPGDCRQKRVRGNSIPTDV